MQCVPKIFFSKLSQSLYTVVHIAWRHSTHSIMGKSHCINQSCHAINYRLIVGSSNHCSLHSQWSHWMCIIICPPHITIGFPLIVMLTFCIWRHLGEWREMYMCICHRWVAPPLSSHEWSLRVSEHVPSQPFPWSCVVHVVAMSGLGDITASRSSENNANLNMCRDIICGHS